MALSVYVVIFEVQETAARREPQKEEALSNGGESGAGSACAVEWQIENAPRS